MSEACGPDRMKWSTYGIESFGGSELRTMRSPSRQLSPLWRLRRCARSRELMTATGGFITRMNSVGTYLNTIGSSINYVNNQTTYNNDKVDALNSGLGSLVDADLAKESAQLTALQIRSSLARRHSRSRTRRRNRCLACSSNRLRHRPASKGRPASRIRTASKQRSGHHASPSRRGRDSMSNLVLELRQGEVMIVNGAPIRFRTRSRIELTAKARFLFGKQIMPPDQVHSPARRIYFALQSAYIGSESEREGGLDSARVSSPISSRRRHPTLFA